MKVETTRTHMTARNPDRVKRTTAAARAPHGRRLVEWLAGPARATQLRPPVGTTRPHRSSQVATTRAEILDLIALRSTGSSPHQPLSAPIRPPAPKAPGYEELVDQIRQLQQQRPWRVQSPQSMAPQARRTSVSPLIRGLEQRLTRLEERLYEGSRNQEGSKPQNKSNDDEDWTFTGVIQGQLLSDMLQLVSSNGMTGLFVVETDDSRCELYFDEGRMCHADANGMQGEKAFFTAFASGRGKYRFRETTQLPPDRTITSSTQFLILEALRQIDESSENKAASP